MEWMDDRGSAIYFLFSYLCSKLCQAQILAHAEAQQTPEVMNECAVNEWVWNPFAGHVLWASYGARCWCYRSE